MKRLFKGFAYIVLVLPIVGCNEIDFTKLLYFMKVRGSFDRHLIFLFT